MTCSVLLLINHQRLLIKLISQAEIELLITMGMLVNQKVQEARVELTQGKGWKNDFFELLLLSLDNYRVCTEKWKWEEVDARLSRQRHVFSLLSPLSHIFPYLKGLSTEIKCFSNTNWPQLNVILKRDKCLFVCVVCQGSHLVTSHPLALIISRKFCAGLQNVSFCYYCHMSKIHGTREVPLWKKMLTLHWCSKLMI